jgi:hypothetical protein
MEMLSSFETSVTSQKTPFFIVIALKTSNPTTIKVSITCNYEGYTSQSILEVKEGLQQLAGCSQRVEKHAIFFIYSKDNHDNSDTHLRLWTGSNP